MAPVFPTDHCETSVHPLIFPMTHNLSRVSSFPPRLNDVHWKMVQQTRCVRKVVFLFLAVFCDVTEGTYWEQVFIPPSFSFLFLWPLAAIMVVFFCCFFASFQQCGGFNKATVLAGGCKHMVKCTLFFRSRIGNLIFLCKNQLLQYFPG